MQSWGKQREIERPKDPAPLSKEQAQAIAQALNGAIGSALGRLTGAAVVPEAKQTEPERKLAALERSAQAGATALSAMTPAVTGPGADGYFEELYQKIKRRLIDECRVDPILLHLLTTSAPEMRIDVEPRVIELNDGSLRGRIALLVGAGFFDAARTQADTIRELRRTGTEPHSGRTSEAFTSLVNDGVLAREGDGYQKAPGVKVTKNILTAAS